MALHPNQAADWLVTRVPSFAKVSICVVLAFYMRSTDPSCVVLFPLSSSCTIAAARLDLSQLDIRSVLHVVQSLGLGDGVAALLGLCQ